MSYHKVSLSASLAWISVTRNPTSSLSVTSVDCMALITGGCTEVFGVGIIATDTLQVWLFGGSPLSVALILEKIHYL